MPGDFDRRFQPARYEVTERLFAQMAEAMRVGLVGRDSAAKDIEPLLDLAKVYPSDAQQSLSLGEGRVSVECCLSIVPGRFEIPDKIIMGKA